MERKKGVKDELYERLSPETRPLYGIVIEIYKNNKSKPVFTEEIEKAGQIEKLTFTNVPAKVMSILFDAVYERPKPFECGCAFEYIFKKGEPDKYEFEISR